MHVCVQTLPGAPQIDNPYPMILQGHWKRQHDSNHYHVAIKVLNEGTATAEASRELLQEGVVMASMDHENVVRLYGLSMGSKMMLVSQFIPLGALLSYLKKYKDALNASTMLKFSVQLASVSQFFCIIRYTITLPVFVQ